MTGGVVRQAVVLGSERRRRWSDEGKLDILGQVGVNGWTVADVARRHDLTRQHIYQWRRELRRKGLWPCSGGTVFLPLEMTAAEQETTPGATGPVERREITVILTNGRELRCEAGIGELQLTRLIRVVETA